MLLLRLGLGAVEGVVEVLELGEGGLDLLLERVPRRDQLHERRPLVLDRLCQVGQSTLRALELLSLESGPGRDE